MISYTLDTSALGKRYVTEVGSAWVRALTAPTAGNALITARITMAEMYSVLARRRREGSVPSEACQVAAEAFSLHCSAEYKFIELELGIIAGARELLDRYPLRAYDAVQLASALAANQALVDRELEPLIFVSADDRLLNVAATAALATDDPRLHS